MSIPIAISGTDLIGQARTGTGKTLAFGVSALQRIVLPGDEGWTQSGSRLPQALVMCPTRELALQVSRDIDTAARVRGARVLTVYGGVGYDSQIDALQRGVDVVVGTPGRLLDLVGRRDLNLTSCSIVVLDEADEMLDLGFLPDVEKLLGHCPTSRQTMLFSATMPAAIMSLARAQLNHPVHIRAEGADSQATVPQTTQYVYQAHPLDKIEIISRLLQSSEVEKTIIFCRTKRACQRLADDLADRGFPARAIHGDLNQVARERALKGFREGRAKVLVATDVAARGIDVTGVSHVVNHECPDDEKTYVHRIGRTGRAGAKGIAVTLVDWPDLTRWKLINKALGLGIDEPVETYSTSTHLFSDLAIPEDATGRLPGAEPRRPRDESHSRGRRREGPKTRGARNRPKRQRSRRRNGVVVQRDAEAAGTAPAASANSRPHRTGSDAQAPATRSRAGETAGSRAVTEPARTSSATKQRPSTSTKATHAVGSRAAGAGRTRRRRARGTDHRRPRHESQGRTRRADSEQHASAPRPTSSASGHPSGGTDRKSARTGSRSTRRSTRARSSAASASNSNQDRGTSADTRRTRRARRPRGH